MIMLVVVSEDILISGKIQESNEMRTGSANNLTSSERETERESQRERFPDVKTIKSGLEVNQRTKEIMESSNICPSYCNNSEA
jgi:hypothetical protein